LSRVPYQTSINGKPYPAKVTTIKNRFGQNEYQATVDLPDGKTAVGYGDTPMEACDAVGGR
jgi:hypothetical protein